jgi:hypothetical protein
MAGLLDAFISYTSNQRSRGRDQVEIGNRVRSNCTARGPISKGLRLLEILGRRRHRATAAHRFVKYKHSRWGASGHALMFRLYTLGENLGCSIVSLEMERRVCT